MIILLLSQVSYYPTIVSILILIKCNWPAPVHDSSLLNFARGGGRCERRDDGRMLKYKI